MINVWSLYVSARSHPVTFQSNQASILDQTIQHIKSLQQQIQVQPKAISLGCDAIKPPAVYPVVLPQGTAVAAAGELLPPAAALPPAVLAMAARGHVRPGLAPLHHLRRWCLSVPFFQWWLNFEDTGSSCCDHIWTSWCTRQRRLLQMHMHVRAAGSRDRTNLVPGNKLYALYIYV